MSYFFSPEITAFFQVVLIDLVLAGDNAIVIGLAAAGLPKEQRNKAILVGVIAATVLRIIFAGLTIQLLQIVGLLFAGGILLLWVCWKMWREIRTSAADEEAAELALEGLEGPESGTTRGPRKTFAQAAWQIVIADVSMSLDNVLAVAGAAREHPYVMIFGLVLSIALMGLAASFIARILQRYRWIAYVGLGHHSLRGSEDDLPGRARDRSSGRSVTPASAPPGIAGGAIDGVRSTRHRAFQRRCPIPIQSSPAQGSSRAPAAPCRHFRGLSCLRWRLAPPPRRRASPSGRPWA